MSTIFGTPIDYMTTKQLRLMARYLLLSPRDLSVTRASLITAIKAA